jgi:hypothetical protein
VGSENELTEAMRELQRRGEQLTPPLPSTATRLFELFRRALHKAVREEVLINAPYDVSKLLRLTRGGRSGGSDVFAITGGPKEFLRATAPRPGDHFVRDDGGVVHFSLEIQEIHGSPLGLIAYNFEVYFPDRQPIPFVRFDLNDRGHSNDDLGLRAHVHPGHDDIQLPSPLMPPLEALKFVLYRCRLRRAIPRS